jgi:hypothetical protein
MADPQQMAAAFEEVLKTGDFSKISEVMTQFAADDFVEEWPQSGERLTLAASKRMRETYQEQSGTSPRFTYKRMLGGGDIFIVEGSIDYGDGVPVSYVGIGEVRDGRISRVTEYFANPFEPPAWRADFVERMDPVTA